MIKKVLFILIICLIFLTCIVSASQKSAVVIATVAIESSNGGHIYPDIVIQDDGSWREGTSNDLFVGQTFTVFNGPKNEKLSKKLRIEKNDGELPLQISNNANLKKGFRYWAYYNSTNASFKIKGIEKLIEPKKINSNTLNQFKNSNTKISIKNIVSSDFDDIAKDFNVKIGNNILQSAQGDINGDNKLDYVAAIGKGFGLPNEGIVVVLYVSDKDLYKRIPIKVWKNQSQYLSGPSTFVFKDVNNDKTEELFVIDADSDCSYPIVYSWFGRGIQMVYAGKTELWGGN